jgi:hypothetical protein
MNSIFILIILLIYIFIFFTNKIEKFNLTKYRIIIIKNKNYDMIYLKNENNINNKIYKIYKNKLIF